MEKTLFLPEEHNTFVWAVVGTGDPWVLLALYLLVMNLLTFFIFGLDKWKAKRKAKNEAVRRVPEKTLFVLSALGGSLGALVGMKVWHHKTLHKAFRYGIPAILIAQVALAVALAVYF